MSTGNWERADEKKVKITLKYREWGSAAAK
jgi:hypothetical protein